MRIGLESFTAGVTDDDDVIGLIILICLGTSGAASPLFIGAMECEGLIVSESVFGDVINRIIGGDVEFDEIDCC